MSKNILGIDVAKKTLSATLLSNNKYKHKEFQNNKTGHLSMHNWLKSTGVLDIEICLEATGAYGDEVSDFMYSLGYVVRVINPLQIKSFAKAKLARHKTDKVDSAIIAEYGSIFESVSYKPLSTERKELRSLYRFSQDIKVQIVVCINHLENEDLLPSLVRNSWKKTKKHYENQLKLTKARILEIIESNNELKEDFINLMTIKGVGEETAIAVLSELSSIDNFEGARQLAAFIGLTPKHNTSGTSVKGRSRISKMGRGGLRKALYFPAMSAMKFNEYFKEFALKLEKAGKSKKCIICAIMRKLVHIIFGILKNKEGFKIEKLRCVLEETYP